ncbi:hypothetical protein ENUP19_0203G0014 [Entamoeba nuttalli]|uniref:SH3 domain-containing protein n=2 Tax=Entamoeba nuttalli TaxID=412467 RepID=K2GSS1_ENTNP|nr:hypothetical protein ENU1_178400 [Entamoeba nuttalli P19]EKE38043.1 hypothetical protein ENU1_178400 [Entamoeba nuttalli P19]|eukprot:XP_008859622.1 hypothetical protein ENU1_178400 [Entamoeba nuttalli P19]
MSFKKVVCFPFKLWNMLPYIQQLVLLTLIILLPFPYMIEPGLLSIPYLLEFLVVSFSGIFTETYILRGWSLLITLYSFVHFILLLVFYLVDIEEHWGLMLCGLMFKNQKQEYYILHTIFVGVIGIISFFGIFSRSEKIIIRHTALVPTLTALFFFISAFVVNSSQGGIIPILFFLASIVLIISPRLLFKFLSVSLAFIMFIYLIILSLWNVFSFVSNEYNFFQVTELDVLQKAMSTVGFSIVKYPSWVFFGMNYVAYLMFPLICLCIKIIFNEKEPENNLENSPQTGITEFTSKTEEDNSEEEPFIDEKKSKNKIIKEGLKQIYKFIITCLAVCLQIIVKGGVFISIIVMFCVGLVNINIFGFSFLVISISLIFIPINYCQKLWPIVIIYTLIIVLMEMIVQLDYIDISSLPSYTGLYKFNEQTTHSVDIQWDDTHLGELISKIILLFVSFLEYYANKIGVKVVHDDSKIEVFKYSCAKFIDFWGLFICCVVIAIAAFYEDINIELILYIIALAILVLLQTHFVYSKVVIQFILPIYSIIFFVVLLVRYVSQFRPDSVYSNNNEIYINNFWDIFTGMSQVEVGCLKYNSLWERLKGFLPNILVIAVCAIESRLLITVPRYLKEVEDMYLAELKKKRGVQHFDRDTLQYSFNRFEQEARLADESNEEKNLTKVELISTSQEGHKILKSKKDKTNKQNKYLDDEEKVQCIPKVICELSDLVMRFLAIYIPHISVICAIIIAAYPIVDSTFEHQTWDCLHFLLFITTMICLLSKKGFNAACAPLLWVCTISMIILIIPNFRTFNQLIDQYNVFGSTQTKIWVYSLIGIKTCFDDVLTAPKCVSYDELKYPYCWDLIKDFLVIFFLIIITRTSFFWGRIYKKKERLTLFRYIDLEYDLKKYSWNKVKYYISNFFSYFGPLYILLVLMICICLHANDFMAILYIIISLVAVICPHKILTKMIPVVEIILLILVIINSVWTIPLEPLDTQWEIWKKWDWDIDYSLRKYTLLMPVEQGKKLLVIKVFDCLFIFLINRISFHFREGHVHEIYKFISPPYFPEESRNIFDGVHRVLLKYFNLICGIVIMLLAVNRKDIISYVYVGMTMYIVFKGKFLRERIQWKILQVLNFFILIVQNIFVLSSLLTYFKDDEETKKTQGINLVLQIFETFGLYMHAGEPFVFNVVILFVMLIRSAVFRQIPETFRKLEDNIEKERANIFVKLKELIDLDRDKIMIELDKKYNEKVLRMKRLDELRELRKKDRLSDFHDNDLVEVSETAPKEIITKGFFQNLCGTTKEISLNCIDALIHFLHSRNLVVRLNLPKNATDEQIEDSLYTTIKPVSKEPSATFTPKIGSTRQTPRNTVDVITSSDIVQSDDNDDNDENVFYSVKSSPENLSINSSTSSSEEESNVSKEEESEVSEEENPPPSAKLVPKNEVQHQLKSMSDIIEMEQKEETSQKSSLSNLENPNVKSNTTTPEKKVTMKTSRIYSSKNQIPIHKPIPQRNYEFIQIHERNEPYKYKGRIYMLFWGLCFYFGQQTEVLVQIILVINELINQNVLSAVFPIIGFAVIALSIRPYPTKFFWNFLSLYNVCLILVRLFFQLPGFCLTPNEYDQQYDVISYTTHIFNEKTMQCDATPLTKNHMSPVYLIGIYPVHRYIASRFIWDILCLFAILIHLSCMRSRGYWKQQYLLRRQWSNLIIENYRRQLVNKIKPRTFGELKFVVEALVDFEAPDGEEDFLSYKKHDLFVVENMQVNGDLFVSKGGKMGLINCENVTIYVQNGKVINSQVCKKSKKVHKKTYDKKYCVKKDKVLDAIDEFECVNYHEVEMLSEKSLEVSEQMSSDKLNNFLKDREEYLREKELKGKNKNMIDKAFSTVYSPLKSFFNSIVNDQFKQGADFYIPLFISEALCFLFLIIFQGTFTNIQGSFIKFFTDDYLPITYVLGLFLQFAMILADRIIYLCKSIKAKLVMQYFSLLLYHILIVIVYPSFVETKTKIVKACLTIFYLFKVVYWTISGLQIRAGYNILSSRRILMTNYSFYSQMVFHTYYTLPFVYEIRTILDWCLSKTSMFYKQWLKVEDIHAELYMNQCDRVIERNRNHVYGQPRGIVERITSGFIMVIVLLAILWFPLLFMSSAAPNFTQPKPTNLEVVLNFVGQGELYKQQQSVFKEITKTEWNELQKDHSSLSLLSGEAIYSSQLSSDAMTYWLLTPQKKKELNTNLLADETLTLTYAISMSRESSAASNSFKFSGSYEMNTEEKKKLSIILNNGTSDLYLSIFPQILEMPTLKEKEVLNAFDNVNITLKPILHFDSTTNLYYWSVQQCVDVDKLWNCSEGIKFFIASPKVPNSGILSALSSLGIIGLYTVVVLALYSLIKSDYVGQAHTIMFKNLPNCLGLLQLCDDIIIARQDGDLRLEEDLVNELITIYRTPSLLFEKTK